MPIASHPSPPASAVGSLTITEPQPFCRVGDKRFDRYLFKVASGVPITDAAVSLCELLEMISEPIFATAMEEREFTARDAWLAKYALDAARAVAGSITNTLQQTFKHDGAASD